MPQLVDADMRAIGVFVGTTRSHDQTGAVTSAFEVALPSGYFAAVLADGQLGGPAVLYYESEACEGTMYLPASETLPGYLFGFGAPTAWYLIAKETRVRQIEAKSMLSVTAGVTSCSEVNLSDRFYALNSNRSEETGLARIQPGRVSLQTVSVSGRAPRKRQSLFNNSGSGAQLYQPGPDACAPGCSADLLANGVCESECNNNQCGYDSGDCSAAEIEQAIEEERLLCAPACAAVDLGDGFCDRACNNAACAYDQGDCSN